MIHHLYIDTRTGNYGWQGDLIVFDDGTYSDGSVAPPIRGAEADLRYAETGKRLGASIGTYTYETRRGIPADNPRMWTRERTVKWD